MSNASKKNAAQNNLKKVAQPTLDAEIAAAVKNAPIATKTVRTTKPAAAKPAPVAKTPRVKKEKVLKVKSAITAKGFAHLTPALITDTLTALAAGEKRADIATRLNLNPGTVSDIASGAPYIRKQYEAAGMTHPKGPYTKYVRPAADEKAARMTARKEGAALRQQTLAAKKLANAEKRELAKAAASVVEVKPAAPVAAPAAPKKSRKQPAKLSLAQAQLAGSSEEGLAAVVAAAPETAVA